MYLPVLCIYYGYTEHSEIETQKSQDDGIHPSGSAAYAVLHLSQQIGISEKINEAMRFQPRINKVWCSFRAYKYFCNVILTVQLLL